LVSVVCIFGDAVLTNGISFEALNNISHTTKKFIAVLNDNEWSIAKNVGAIASPATAASHISSRPKARRPRRRCGR